MDSSNIQRPNILITPPAQAGGGAATETAGFGFNDALDTINPLHQIPGVSTAYQELSGDRPNPVPRILGGLLFGGVVGLVLGVANAIVEQVSGKDIGSNVLAMLKGETTGNEAQPELSVQADSGVNSRGNTINPYLVASNFSSGGEYQGSNLDTFA